MDAEGKKCKSVREALEEAGTGTRVLDAAKAAGSEFLYEPTEPVTLFLAQDGALSSFRSAVGLSPLAFLQSASVAVSVGAYSVVPGKSLSTGEDLASMTKKPPWQVLNAGPVSSAASAWYR